MASTTIMNRLGTSITNSTGTDKPNSLTRYFGGHNRQNHPFVNGYWQLYLSPPTKIFNTVHSDAINWFHCTCEGFTPPSRTLNKADVPGQGGLGSSFVTGQTLTRTFSITFREYRNLPMLQMLHLWTSVIDPYVGVSEFSGSEWMSSSYKGSGFVVLTKPTGAYDSKSLQEEDFEEVFFFHGVWPEAAPHDALATDISTNDVLQYNTTFSFDGFPLTKSDDGVVAKAKTLLSNLKYINTYEKYLADINTTTVAAGGASGTTP